MNITVNENISNNFCDFKLNIINGRSLFYNYYKNEKLKDNIIKYLNNSLEKISPEYLKLLVFYDKKYNISNIFIVLLSCEIYLMVPFTVINNIAIFDLKICIFDSIKYSIETYENIKEEKKPSIIFVRTYKEKFIAVDEENNIWYITLKLCLV